MESPIFSSACATVPFGPGMRNLSSALKAFFRKSISLAAPLTVKYGVTVWYPVGTACTLVVAGIVFPPILILSIGRGHWVSDSLKFGDHAADKGFFHSPVWLRIS